jgi:hypothetical protein
LIKDCGMPLPFRILSERRHGRIGCQRKSGKKPSGVINWAARNGRCQFVRRCRWRVWKRSGHGRESGHGRRSERRNRLHGNCATNLWFNARKRSLDGKSPPDLLTAGEVSASQKTNDPRAQMQAQPPMFVRRLEHVSHVIPKFRLTCADYRA